MKKKTALTVAAVALMGTLAVGGTLAWFTDTETATNVVTMGEVDIVLSEDGEGSGITTEDGLKYEDIMPGDTFKKLVSIKNLEQDAYVRATITVDASPVILATFTNDNDADDLIFDGLVIPEGTDWVVKDGKATITVMYDGKMVKDDNWVVFSNIKVPTCWGNEFVKENFSIKVDAEAIQADNLTADKAWSEFDKIESPDLKNADGKSIYDAATLSEATQQ